MTEKLLDRMAQAMRFHLVGNVVPTILLLPLLGGVGMVGIWLGTRWRRDGVPSTMAMLVVTCAFAMLGASFWSYMIRIR